MDSVEYKNQLSPVVLDAERMINDAKAQEIDGILKIAAALLGVSGKELLFLSPSTAQSLWRSVHSLRLRWPVLRNPDHTPAVISAVIRAVISAVISAVIRAVINPASPPSPSRKNQSKNWVLVENEINHLHKPVDASPDLS